MYAYVATAVSISLSILLQSKLKILLRYTSRATPSVQYQGVEFDIVRSRLLLTSITRGRNPSAITVICTIHDAVLTPNGGPLLSGLRSHLATRIATKSLEHAPALLSLRSLIERKG